MMMKNKMEEEKEQRMDIFLDNCSGEELMEALLTRDYFDVPLAKKESDGEC